MNIRQLEYFITAADTLNFTKAAQMCFVSQTAMTQQIKTLEKTVGVPLFYRDSHHVELTTAGKIYYNEAKQLVEHSNRAIELARLASEGIEGELTIGYVSGLGHSDLAEILYEFHHTFPSIKVHIVRENTSVLMEMLGNGHCDVIFSLDSVEVNTQDYVAEYWKNYPIMAVMHPENPLSQKEKVTYKDLEKEDFIMMEPTARPKEQFEESLLIYERGGYIPNIVEMERDPETLLLMIAMGIGISILPEYIVHNRENEHNLSLLPIVKADGTMETINTVVVYRKDNTNPVIQRLFHVL